MNVGGNGIKSFVSSPINVNGYSQRESMIRNNFFAMYRYV